MLRHRVVEMGFRGDLWLRYMVGVYGGNWTVDGRLGIGRERVKEMGEYRIV